MLRTTLLAALFLSACVGHGHADENFPGFMINGEVINPMCLEKMHPWYSDGDIIIKSINLDYCQNSNWASSPNPVEIKDGVVSVRMTDRAISEVSSDTFSYKALGRTKSGLYVVLLPGSGEIAAYTIEEETIRDDLFGNKTSRVHILTAVAQTWLRCLDDAWMKGEKVVVRRRIPHEDKPRPGECDTKLETVEFELP